MEFRQLEAYVAVYELESFSKAAKELFISQPSVSAYITSLEKELDTQLILRSAREFNPTEAGTALYRQAKNMISIRDNALCQIRELNRGEAGENPDLCLLRSGPVHPSRHSGVLSQAAS